jgi:O-antigen/teichoic acid export membrane protein
MSDSLKAKTVSNMSYNLVAQFIGFGIRLVSSIILTQILAPSDYGINAFAMIIIGFVLQFNDMGINTAVVRQATLTDTELYTAFTLKLIIAIVLCSVLILAAPLTRHFFDNPDVVTVVRVLALSFMINAFTFIPNILLTRDLNYKLLSQVNIVGSIIVTALTIMLAYQGFGYWSLVFSSLANSLFTMVAMNYLRPKTIRLMVDTESARQFFSFGMNLFFLGLISFAILNFDNLLVGSIRGATELGYYGLAFNWGSFAFSLISSIGITVLVPTFAKFQHDRPKVKAAFLQLFEGAGLLAVLINCTLFLCSHEFLYYVLGKGTDKWLPALPVLQIFCLYGILRAVIITVGPPLLAIGNTRVFLISDSLLAVVQFILIYPVLTRYGIEGLAVLVTAAYSLQYFVYFPALKREIDLTFGETLAALTPVAIAGCVALAVGLLLFPRLPTGLVWMLVKGVITVVVVLLTHGLCTGWKLLTEGRFILNSWGVLPRQT